ncbi:MAG: pyridoxal 5'-phosphate synthase glutaminase subunit PdxT [Solirubrobacterales bacterium]|nr:pyridoxal 5'-phosphate synthase glutaminase subunit PdxT [Solirubrobacterales bacterium]
MNAGERPNADDCRHAAHRPNVGVLALQGDFEAHARILRGLHAEPREVRIPADLTGLDALVLPGGESTVMSLGIEREGLGDPLRELAAAGTPVLGTCAGLIMLDRDHLGVLDVRAQRNAFGRQLRSFEADLDIAGVPGGPLHAVFIRAPWVAEVGQGVEVLAAVDEHPVAVRERTVIAVSFHPELTGEPRLHALLLGLIDAPASVRGADV